MDTWDRSALFTDMVKTLFDDRHDMGIEKGIINRLSFAPILDQAVLF